MLLCTYVPVDHQCASVGELVPVHDGGAFAAQKLRIVHGLATQNFPHTMAGADAKGTPGNTDDVGGDGEVACNVELKLPPPFVFLLPTAELALTSRRLQTPEQQLHCLLQRPPHLLR